MEYRKRAQRRMQVMLGFLLVLILFGLVFMVSLYTFNNTKRQFASGNDCADFTVNIAPRTGQTDSWIKILTENGKTVNYTGSIYDVTLNNTGKCNISRWLLRIDIEQDMYLNNAWCGTFEIHQTIDGKEQVQTVDLREYKSEELTLTHTIADPDLLIPLHAGDYIIYHPDFATDEYPIPQGDSEKLTQVVFGFIVYNKANTTISFDKYSIEYYLQAVYIRNPVFIGLCVCFLIWLISVISFVAVEANMKKAHIRFKQDEFIIHQSIGVFTRFFEAKDIYTNGHSQRVAEYSKMIAEKHGLSDDVLRSFYYIALMHDCGKCYIPDAILKKPGKLTVEEYEIIKSHTVKGAEMLEDFTSVEHIRDGVLYHHERYDGNGYPEGLKGEEIPLVARIICIADSFDAMNSRRYYRDFLTKDYIISEIENNKGKQFDSQLADLFLELIREGKINFTSETTPTDNNKTDAPSSIL